jgi:hypothetical protein
MAEIALLSNQSSSLYASSKSSGGSDQSSYIYDMKQSGINKFTERNIRTPLNNPAFGSNVQCEIPAFGILRQMVLKTTIQYNIKTNAQTPIVAKALFAELIDQVSIKNSSRELQVIYGDCLKYLVYNLGSEKSKKWKILGKDDLLVGDVNMLDNTAADAYTPRRPSASIKTAPDTDHTIDVYTILPFSMFADFGSDKHTPFKNLLNTRFIERISLDVKYNPRSKALSASAATASAKGFTTEPIISKSELICCFDVIQDKELAAIEAANYSLSQPLALVLGNWNKTRSTFTAAATENDFETQLFNTDLAHSILITCKKVNTSAQLENLGAAVNIPSCNTDGADGNVIATNVCGANAQFTEGYGTAIATFKHDAITSLTALTNFDEPSAKKIMVGLGGPMPPTNKHCIPHDCNLNLTVADDGIALDLRASQGTAVANGVGVSRQGADHQTISQIILTSAGRELYRADNHLEALYLGNSEMKGCCWFDDTNHRVGEDADIQDQNGCSPYNMYLVKFGDDNNLDAIRGFLSMKNLNSVKLSVKVPNCVVGAKYEVNVYVRKYSAISIEASSGRVSTAVST